MKEKPTEISFFFSSFPDHVTQDNLQKVFANYGQVVDVYVSKNINKFGKRFEFVKFVNIGDVQTFETLLNTILIGSFKLRVSIDRRNNSKCSVTHPEKGEQSVKITMDQKRSYADLPMDILSSIAGRLMTPMDLLSFHGTCKGFRSASSEKVEFSTPPWLLFHETNRSRYIGYDKDNSKTYYGNIPDVKGAVKLASGHEWLLLSKDESIFFRSMLSDSAKIVLPDFPHKYMYNHVAAFSDVPMSPHCVVCIFNRIIEEGVTEVSVICQGQSVWTQHTVQTPFSSEWTDFTAATFDHESQTFYYIDEIEHYVLKVSAKDEKWIPFICEKIHTSVVPYRPDFPTEVVNLRRSIFVKRYYTVCFFLA